MIKIKLKKILRYNILSTIDPAVKSTIAPSKILAVLLAITLIVGIPVGAVKFFYHANSQTDIERSLEEDKQKLAKLESEKNELVNKIETENKQFGFTSTLDNYKINISSDSKWQVAWETNFGDLKFKLDSKDAPVTVENFVRLNARNNYKNSGIHRVVKQENVAIIQGGDFDKFDGTGGQSAYYISEQLDNLIPDENWQTKPDVNLETGETKGGIVSNIEFYKNFNSQTGEIEYPKGLILMAKKKYPDSASSQFFITLEKTILPAQYTVFGKVNADTIITLDKISKEVSIGDGSKTPGDGFPNKEIKIINTEVKKL
jgi:cyclophilin family peptidyl-prolyl cis-trans isomerase